MQEGFCKPMADYLDFRAGQIYRFIEREGNYQVFQSRHLYESMGEEFAYHFQIAHAVPVSEDDLQFDWGWEERGEGCTEIVAVMGPIEHHHQHTWAVVQEHDTDRAQEIAKFLTDAVQHYLTTPAGRQTMDRLYAKQKQIQQRSKI